MPTMPEPETNAGTVPLRRLRGLALCHLSWLIAWIPAVPSVAQPPTADSLHLGVLLDYSGPLGVHGKPTETGILLAVEHINNAGGVLGQPVRLTVADGQTDPKAAAEQARSLVDQGVHALIGPSGSAAALEVAEALSGPLRVPTVTPSATSPDLTDADDGDFLFRTVISDSAQGSVLATLAAREGLQRLAVIYQPDSYGRGLLKTLVESFDGEIDTFEVTDPELSFLPDLRSAADDGSQTLMILTYLGVAEKVLQEAMAEDLFQHYLLADAITTADLALALDSTKLSQITATGPGGAGPDQVGSQVVAREMQESLGQLPQSASLTAYDATICVCLAAEHANSTAPVAIRDSLRQVCGNGGLTVGPGSAGVRAALAAIRSGEPVDYDGAASAVNWDEAGDITDGFVGVYHFVTGTPTMVERIRFAG